MKRDTSSVLTDDGYKSFLVMDTFAYLTVGGEGCGLLQSTMKFQFRMN